jgi:glycerol-3-phosphate acyltransferase PlsY
LILDGGKRALAAVAARYLAPELAPIAAVFAVLGHLYPVWLGFNGGKGFAAALGALAVLSLPIALGVGLTWLIVAAIFRFSSLSTLISIALAPVYAWIGNEQRIAIAALIIAAFLWARHRQNIQRLRTGKEPKIGKKAFRPAASG